MKCLSFLAVFLLFFSSLSAQRTPRIEQLGDNRRTETHDFMLGGDSVRYTILNAKDTLMTDVFGLNGEVMSRSWRKDSVYYYRQLGGLFAKKYSFYEGNNPKIVDSTVLYFVEGSVSAMRIVRNDEYIQIYFDKNGKVENKVVRKDVPSFNYVLIEVNNQKVKTFRRDTQVIGKDSFYAIFDTLFYPNKQIWTVEHNLSPFNTSNRMFYEDNAQYSKREYYDKKGQLLLSVLPDSLRFIPFKDNVNCYYGFKNRRGDTLIAPRFDDIQKIYDDYFICEEGQTKTVMRANGEIVKTGKMQMVKPIGRINDNGMRGITEGNYTFLNKLRGDNINLFVYKEGNKYGVFDKKGRVIVPPQYESISDYENDQGLFTFYEQVGHRVKKEGLIDSVSGEIIGRGRYPSVVFLASKNFFVFSDSGRYADIRRVGLINREGEVVLPNRYVNIERFWSNLFWVDEVDKKREADDETRENAKRGLFDAENRRWILKPAFKTDLHAVVFSANKYIGTVMYDKDKKQFGLLDSTGKWLLNPVYDVMTNVGNQLLILAQKGTFTLYDNAQHKTISQVYQNLSLMEVYNRSPSNIRNFEGGVDDRTLYFVAKQRGKWGIINQNEKIIVPFDYNYAGLTTMNDGRKAMVKNDKAAIFSYEFFPKPIPENYLLKSNSLSNANTYTTIEGGYSFTTNNKGSIVIPPQYKTVADYVHRDNTDRVEYSEYGGVKNQIKIIENQKKQRKIFYAKEGLILDFPFLKPLYWTTATCPLVILGEYGKKTEFHVANLKTGQFVKDIAAGGVSIGDAQNGTFFIKTNVPPLPSEDNSSQLRYISNDTLVFDDNGWLMYNASGQQISKDSFRFPIKFYENVGWGMVGEKYGLWQSDGTAIAPPQYENAFRDKNTGTFAFFQNIGLKNWLVLLDKKGKMLVSTGRYDGISDFYGKYALVKNEGKLGLIDSLGNEIVPLTDLATAFDVNFRDSLNAANTAVRLDTIFGMGQVQVVKNIPFNLPFNIFNRSSVNNNPDSLKLAPDMRNIVWNRLTEACIMPKMHTASTTKLEKAKTFKTYYPYHELPKGNNDRRGRSQMLMLFNLFVDSNRLAFSILKDTTDKAVYYNFEKKNGAWHPLSTNALFDLHPDNTRKINDLLAQKIKNLKEADIDCGTSSSFWERAQNNYLAHKDGIVFYFLTKPNERDMYQQFQNINFEKTFVPILITWAELKPFLRK